ncbi:MAG: NAD(P)H-dependent oxidoreductase [Alphaproteobacteria bacterium]|nr:NAD(P)H-dependent oxidoreductase [Alphaproteobacteria bacterium]MBU1514187.1 NAD(P)H-dependent oxidoreductase [Alphaproteobacteria bacterium]MBU2096164.1 NAD(P)H-dependent oxidoreductase [Alphaproteobacteria bacterium]MBU2151118.1 NAD(P)H-dependent oxidoreductase [Alphaproteobacteria bacterium]MBU2307223.1 NAD(P)H-dependent oxidoreductase [Alphaproteobacteria bacterium]
MSGRRPLILGLGGTIRAGSSTEKALMCALRRAEALGAETRLLGGEFLGSLPIFDPRPSAPSEAQLTLAEAIRAADGVIVASPGYHGSISGVIKNALDTLELTSKDPQPYLTAKPVGTIITAAGAQAGGTTLMALRAIIHALRGWPTPFGAALNAGGDLFDEIGACKDDKDAWQLDTVAEQVVEFAQMKARR